MTYHPLLEDLAKWENEEHFYAVRYNWWYNFSGFNGTDWVQERLEKDEHKTPTTIRDFKTGDLVSEISTFSFTHNLGLRINSEFKKLLEDLQEKFLTLEKESQKISSIALIAGQLDNILGKVTNLELKGHYKKVIVEEIGKGIETINKLSSLEIKEVSSAWSFKYTCENEIDKKSNLSSFTEELIRNGLIDGSEGNIRNFKTFFIKGKTNDYIVWTGKKSELVTFFRELVSKNFIESENHWVSVRNCFIILHKSKEYSTNGLKSEKGTQSKKKKEMLFSLIDLLEE